MFKKFLSAAPGFVLAAVLSACGGTPPATEPATGQPQPTDAATAAPTEAQVEQTPEGGLGTNGGAQVEAITAENVDRLNTLYQMPLASFMTSMSFSPDSKLLAVGTAKGGVVFNLETQQQIASFSPDTPLFGLAWSPDSKLIVGVPGAMANGTLSIWDVTTNAESDLLKDKLAGQTAFAFSPDGTQAASGGPSGDVTIWNLSSGDPVAGFNVTEAGADTSAGQPKVSSLAFAGTTLIVGAVGAVDETMLWDLSAGKALTKPTPANHVAGPVATALFAPGDLSHVYWWSRGDVVVVDLVTDQETGRLTTEDIIQSAAFSPDGKLLAVGAAGSVNGAVSPLVKLWSTATGQDVKILSSMTQIPTAMAFSPDGSKLAFGFGGDGVAVWGLVQNQ